MNVSISNAQEKFMHELGDIYDAEHRFLKGQQEMLKNASDATLKTGLERHIAETEQHIGNLDQVFQILGAKPKAVPCEAAKGLVEEAKTGMKEAKTDELRDCMIGGSASRVEHYEMAAYRGLLVDAELMGQQQIVWLLQQNLQQEEKTAQTLEQNAPMLAQRAMRAEGAAAAR
jgi:ferritin-like metal-binding protein YciE